MKSEATRECREVFAQDETTSVQPRLQRLRFHSQHCTRFFGRQPLDVTKHHRDPVNLRQMRQRAEQLLAHLPPQHLVISER